MDGGEKQQVLQLQCAAHETGVLPVQDTVHCTGSCVRLSNSPCVYHLATNRCYSLRG